MTPNFINYLCKPITKIELQLVDDVNGPDGSIQQGGLVRPSGNRYSKINGSPRFVDYVQTASVASFCEDWNFFNFTDFKNSWHEHRVTTLLAELIGCGLRISS